jgi:probable phosphoglycerate mutase
MIADVRGCEGLTETGVQQAQALAARLRTWPQREAWATVLSSPVRRALETAKHVGEALGAPEIVLRDDLRELAPGEADGLLRDDYRSRYGAFNPADEPDHPFAPKGESWNQFERRVAATLDALARDHAGRNVVAVSHAGFIVNAFLRLMAVTAADRAWLEPANTGLTEWRHDGHRWRLERYNDTSHLA